MRTNTLACQTVRLIANDADDSRVKEPVKTTENDRVSNDYCDAASVNEDAIRKHGSGGSIETSSAQSTVRHEEKHEIEKWWDEDGGTVEVKEARKNSSMVFSHATQKFVEVPYDSWTGSPLKDRNNALR